MIEDKPTVLSQEHFEQAVKEDKERSKSLFLKIVNCPSCYKQIPYILSDYYTGQCSNCFSKRKPWINTSPVKNAYFKITKID